MTQIVTSETAVATDVSTNESAAAVSDQQMVKSRIPNTMRQELRKSLRDVHSPRKRAKRLR